MKKNWDTYGVDPSHALKESVFRCPSQKDSECSKNLGCYLSYGAIWPWVTDHGGPSLTATYGKKITAFTRASEMMILIDMDTSTGWNRMLAGDELGLIAYRHTSKTNILYLDGHVEAKGASQLPVPYSTANANNVFWRGGL